MEINNCPVCNRKINILGGPEKWIPTFHDPDSGGKPYYIKCECGLKFSIGHCEEVNFITAWNEMCNDNYYK